MSWRQVPDGIRVTQQQVVDAIVADGYNPDHAVAFVQACKRSEAFVVTKAEPKKFFEWV